MAEWTHRLCERCWFDGPPQGLMPWRGPIPGVLEDGAYRQPNQLRDPEPGACCGCGGFTITGIYFRHDATQLRCQGRHDDLSWSRVSTRLGVAEEYRST